MILLSSGAGRLALCREHGALEVYDLRARKKTAPRPDAATVRRHIRDLASDDFAARQRAEAALRRLGQPVRGSLKAALTGASELEVRLRLRRLLAQVGRITPEWLRQQHAILALEVRATPDARELLQRLAGGAPGAWLTDEARAALRRLEPVP